MIAIIQGALEKMGLPLSFTPMQFAEATGEIRIIPENDDFNRAETGKYWKSEGRRLRPALESLGWVQRSRKWFLDFPDNPDMEGEK